MQKILSLDVGKKKIGIAITDLLQITAQPHSTIRSNNLNQQIDKIISIIDENSIKTVVVGLPKNMNDSLGEQAEWTKKFISKILEKRQNLDIIYIDERLTSKMALNSLKHINMKKIKEKGLIDTVAAVNILETYLKQKENGIYNNANK